MPYDAQPNTDPTTAESLDPQNWDALRDLGRRMVDDMLSYLETLRDRPTWQPMPDDIRRYFDQPIPNQPRPVEAVYDDFRENILPYPLGNIHPRFWGWVIGTGTPLGALAEMLAATMNPNLGGGDHVANEVEKQVLRWCKEMLDFPVEDSSGILVSGGSMANFVGIAVARNAKAPIDIRAEGVLNLPAPMVFYASAEVHSSLKKTAELLGLGHQALRLIPTNDAYQIDLEALQAAIAQDKAAGLQPFCVVGNAGTVNTGAFDDLNALADICQREGLWFHVDGAFGALAALAPDYRHLTDGMTRADSLAFDLHKWLYMPIEIGCTLVRSDDVHYEAFTYTPPYLTHGERGAAAGERWFSDYGLQLSRGFRALKAWMSFKHHGLETYRRLIQQNIEQVQYLVTLIEAQSKLELVAPAPSNIACFRYVVDGWETEALNDLNQRIMYELHERGIAVPSYTTLGDIFALRVAHTNHRTQRADFDVLIEAVLSIGDELATQLQ